MPDLTGDPIDYGYSHFFPFDIPDTPYYSPEEIHHALDDQLERPENIEWKG